MDVRDSRPSPSKSVWEHGGLSKVYADYCDAGLRAVCGEERRLPADRSERFVSDAKAGSETVHLLGWFIDDASRTEGGRIKVMLFESRHGAIVLRILDIGGEDSRANQASWTDLALRAFSSVRSRPYPAPGSGWRERG